MEIVIEQLKNITSETTEEIDNLLNQLDPNSRRLNDNDIKEIIDNPSNRIFVAKEKNKIIGMSTLIVNLMFFCKKGSLEDVVVDNEYRGRGIGTKLINYVVARARDEGLRYIDFTSSPTRIAANNLYQYLGFKRRDTNVYRIEL